MSNDPLPSSDDLAESPDDADYDALHAEIAATERGRNFLREYTRRHSHADARRLVGTISRLEAAMRANPPPQVSTTLTRGLADLAASLAQVEAILANSPSASDDLFAAERLEDIAMAVRQRQVEAALCDALEAAAREVGDALVRNNAAATRAVSAAALLRDVARRVDDMTALVKAVASPAPGVGEADSARSPAEAPEIASPSTMPPNRPGSDSIETSSGTPSDERPDESDSRGEVSANGKWVVEGKTDQDAVAAGEASTAADQVLQSDAASANGATPPPADDEIRGTSDAGRFGHTGREQAASALATRSLHENRTDSPLEKASMPSSPPGMAARADPNDDPGDLFEPLIPSATRQEAVEQVRARESEAAASNGSSAQDPAEVYSPPEAAETGIQLAPTPSAQPRADASPRESLAPCEPPNDPLAAVLTLSEEELIALFS
jgi:hypothetical protein